jgi:hypothetical protein
MIESHVAAEARDAMVRGARDAVFAEGIVGLEKALPRRRIAPIGGAIDQIVANDGKGYADTLDTAPRRA